MKIWIKIGTMPAAILRVSRLRKPPKIRTLINVIEDEDVPQKLSSVWVDGVKEIAGKTLYFAERM